MEKIMLHCVIFLFSSLLMVGCKEETEGTLYGIVADSRTGEPVKNAFVELSYTSLKTTTGSDGWYQFSEVEAGEYEMTVSKVGYDVSKESGIIVSDGPVRYDVKLVSFPSFVFDGCVYMVAPNAEDAMTLSDAKAYCQGLTQYGYSDWRLPTYAELIQMYADKESIGGFLNKVYWSSTYSSTTQNVDLYYAIHFLNGEEYEANPGSKLRVRPIRVDQ